MKDLDYSRFSSLVRYVQSRVGNEAIAEDIVQEAYISLLQYEGSTKKYPSLRLLAWMQSRVLGKIFAVKRGGSGYRTKKEYPLLDVLSIDDDDFIEPFLGDIRQVENQVILREFLFTLPKHRRSTFFENRLSNTSWYIEQYNSSVRGRKKRFPVGATLGCPSCGKQSSQRKDGFSKNRFRVYECGHCGRHYTVKTSSQRTESQVGESSIGITQQTSSQRTESQDGASSTRSEKT